MKSNFDGDSYSNGNSTLKFLPTFADLKARAYLAISIVCVPIKQRFVKNKTKEEKKNRNLNRQKNLCGCR